MSIVINFTKKPFGGGEAVVSSGDSSLTVSAEWCACDGEGWKPQVVIYDPSRAYKGREDDGIRHWNVTSPDIKDAVAYLQEQGSKVIFSSSDIREIATYCRERLKNSEPSCSAEAYYFGE